MDLPQELDDYIKESIESSLGLPVSEKTLDLKLQASEEARKRLQDQYFYLRGQLKEKDELVDRSRAEASMNAQALKKFIEENQKLANECSNLLGQCSRLQKECSLYERDRDVLMEFGNEADQRAKENEIRVLEVEKELGRLAEDLQFYKHECEMHKVNETRSIEELHLLRERLSEGERVRIQGRDNNHISCSHCSLVNTENQKSRSQIQASIPGDSFKVDTILEGHLLDSVVATLIDKDKVLTNARAFLEENRGVESCQRLLNMWECLTPSTQNVLFLAAEVKTLQKDKEHLRINLHRAEEEVKLLFEENNILDEENKRLLRQCNRERNHPESGGKHTSSASAKGNKRKSSPKPSSPIERTIDFNILDSPRQPLSPLQLNSHDSRMHKR